MATASAESLHFTKVCEILECFQYNPSKLIPILQQVQKEYRYLPQEVLIFLATSLNLAPARVFGVATFYSHFTLEPKGKHVVKLCDGTACHVKQSNGILEALQEYLELSDERKTTPDMLFTVETVSCLGACGLAPVVVIDDRVYGQMTPQRAIEEVKVIQKRELQK